MDIYNINKTTKLDNPDLSLGKLITDKIHVHIDEVPSVPDKGHYETTVFYDNGGADVEFIVDEKGSDFVPAQDYDEDILIYVPYTEDELVEIEISKLRRQRETECFSICDRAAWYDSLTEEQKQDIQKWRAAWLGVTETKVIPEKPEWLI